MIYNPSNPLDVSRSIEKIKYFIGNNKVFELTEKRTKRTISQNAYLHLLFGWFALETGYTTEEVKQEIFKKIVNSNTFYEGEFGELIKIERWRSTANLDTQELTLCINRFRDYASKEAGIYLPEPNDLALIQEIEIQIKNNPNYL
jgi:hypothetical protein